MMPSLYKRIQPDVALALSTLLTQECKRLPFSTRGVAGRGGFTHSRVKALRRGESVPNLAEFIVLTWALYKDPRELFDKLLTEMRLAPGWRPEMYVH
jgi:hypothetical protein